MIRTKFLSLTLLVLTLIACNSQQSMDDGTSSGPAPVWGSTASETAVVTPSASPQPTLMQPEIVTATPSPSLPFPAMTPMPQAKMATADYPPRVNVDQLRSMMQNNNAVVIDVRTLDVYQQSHIVGSLHIPYDQVTARSGEVPKGKTIVTYCT